jgi:hypothetical protein
MDIGSNLMDVAEWAGIFAEDCGIYRYRIIRQVVARQGRKGKYLLPPSPLIIYPFIVKPGNK